MAHFYYKASRKDGTRYEGELEAPDKFALYREVRKEGGVILSVREKRKRFSLETLSTFFSSGASHAEKIAFTRNLAAMIEAGLSLSRALEVLRKQTKNKKFQGVLSQIGESIKKGSPLHQALAEYPAVFSQLLISMVKAGEESGSLAGSLKVVGIQMERAYTLKKKVRGAMIYPAIVISAMVAIGVLMLIFVVPTLSSTFEELGVELPASTAAIIGISNFLVNNTLLALGLAVVFVFLLASGMKTKRGMRITHFAVLRIPIVGGIVKEVNAARTARTLSSLLSSGVSALQALAITRDVIQNMYYKRVLEEASALVEKGLPMSEAFERHLEIYPVLLAEMMAVGEETGQVAPMLLRIAEFYEGEVEQKTKDMSTVIEPFLMLAIGSGVGFFAIAMISPIYSLSNGI